MTPKTFKKALVKQTNKQLSSFLSYLGFNSVVQVVNDVCDAIEKDM